MPSVTLGKGAFAECHDNSTGQNCAKPAQVPDLPSAMVMALGKTGHFAECRRCGTRQRIFWEKIKKIFCRVPDTSPLGKGDVRRAVSVRSTFLCRVLTWHSANALSSVRYIALDKELFADKSYAGGSLLSVTLGKLFAECKLGFAECLGHSAKNPCLVVEVPNQPRALVD